MTKNTSTPIGTSVYRRGFGVGTSPVGNGRDLVGDFGSQVTTEGAPRPKESDVNDRSECPKVVWDIGVKV